VGSRQAGILVREVLDAKRTQNAEEWPCFIAGGIWSHKFFSAYYPSPIDFNCPPRDAAYALLTGQTLNTEHRNHLSSSRVTHISVDPSVPEDNPSKDVDQEESDPDRVITNARSAIAADGLLNDDELLSLFSQGHRLSSAYDTGLSRIQNHNIALYGDRVSLQQTQPGFHEPSYTSYTHYWQSVLGVSRLVSFL